MVPYTLKSEQIISRHVSNTNIAPSASKIGNSSAQNPNNIFNPVAKFSVIYTFPIPPIANTNRRVYVNKNHCSSHSLTRSCPGFIRTEIYFCLDRAREKFGNIFQNCFAIYFLCALLNYIRNNSVRKRVVFSKVLIKEAYCTYKKEYN